MIDDLNISSSSSFVLSDLERLSVCLLLIYLQIFGEVLTPTSGLAEVGDP